MKAIANFKVLFIAGFGPIVREARESRVLAAIRGFTHPGVVYEHVHVYPALIQWLQKLLDSLRVREIGCLYIHAKHWQLRVKFLRQFGQAFCAASDENQAIEFRSKYLCQL